jgi:hypothetical protein
MRWLNTNKSAFTKLQPLHVYRERDVHTYRDASSPTPPHPQPKRKKKIFIYKKCEANIPLKIHLPHKGMFLVVQQMPHHLSSQELLDILVLGPV